MLLGLVGTAFHCFAQLLKIQLTRKQRAHGFCDLLSSLRSPPLLALLPLLLLLALPEPC